MLLRSSTNGAEVLRCLTRWVRIVVVLVGLCRQMCSRAFVFDCEFVLTCVVVCVIMRLRPSSVLLSRVSVLVRWSLRLIMSVALDMSSSGGLPYLSSTVCEKLGVIGLQLWGHLYVSIRCGPLTGMLGWCVVSYERRSLV